MAEHDPIKIVADGFLAQQGFVPEEVYAFIKTLEGAPDIENIGFGNSSPYIVAATVTAHYKGKGVWGGKEKPLGSEGYGLASDEFQETSRSLFKAIAEYTGYSIKEAKAQLRPDHCRARVALRTRPLTMIVTKSE